MYDVIGDWVHDPLEKIRLEMLFEDIFKHLVSHDAEQSLDNVGTAWVRHNLFHTVMASGSCET